MRKSGLADSPLFIKPKTDIAPTTLSNKPLTEKKNRKENNNIKEVNTTRQPINRVTATPRNHDTMVSRYHSTIIELVRKAVKELGKEAATHRFTLEEKRAIADIIYSYKNLSIKTSENEVTRIAVNFIIRDYMENGENSILDKTLKALND